MPIVPYMPLSEMIMIGLAPYWQAVAISLPIINAPPSPTKATTCVPGRRNAAATAIGMPEPIAPTTEDEKDLPLAEADIAMDKAAEIAGVGRHRGVGRQVLVDLADDRGEIDAVARSAPIPWPAACGGSR